MIYYIPPMPFSPLFVLLFFAVIAYGQQKVNVAIINTVDDGEPPIEHLELNHLTDRLREIAVKILPQKYAVMTQQTIVSLLGSQEQAAKKCLESEGCLAKLGKEIYADYIGQARIGRFGGELTIKTELYDTKSGSLIGSFTGNSKDIFGLLAIIDERSPDLFKKVPGVSSKSSLFVAGGISGLEKSVDYELDSEKSYLVNLSTEPPGAVLSFDGVPSASCARTPCKAELAEGKVRIIAAMEQYETADTTVSIVRNNQSIAIKLKSNFGVLDIKPAYLDGVGEHEQWSLTINGKAASSWENRFSPGKYRVELAHRCYEPLSFEAGINKGSREVFDMASNITLKKGGLALSAERNNEPVSEPVFVNEMLVGETPYSGAVPLCAKIEVGENRETVYVTLKYNDKIKHVHKMGFYTPVSGLGDSYTSTPEIEKSGNASFWVALGLDVLGAAFIYFGYERNKSMMDSYNKYKSNGRGGLYLDSDWDDAAEHRNARNILYTVGGIFLASGIGVHIWF